MTPSDYCSYLAIVICTITITIALYKSHQWEKRAKAAEATIAGAQKATDTLTAVDATDSTVTPATGYLLDGLTIAPPLPLPPNARLVPYGELPEAFKPTASPAPPGTFTMKLDIEALKATLMELVEQAKADMIAKGQLPQPPQAPDGNTP